MTYHRLTSSAHTEAKSILQEKNTQSIKSIIQKPWVKRNISRQLAPVPSLCTLKYMRFHFPMFKYLLKRLILFYFYFYLFIFGCVGSSFLCEGFLQLRRAGATLHRGARASHYRGLSVAEHRFQTHRLSSCGTRAQLLRGMWDLPRPGLEPASPALAGRFPTTAPPGKPLKDSF